MACFSRKSCLFKNIVISCLNFPLLILSLFSFIPVILLRNPPNSLGLSLLAVSLVSLISSFVGASSHQSRSCFIVRITLQVSSLTGQVLAVLMLFSREKQSLSLLMSTRDPREAKALVRIECVVLMVMIPFQILVLVFSYLLHSYWTTEFEGLDVDSEDLSKSECKRKVSTVEEGIGSKVDAMKLEENKSV